MWINKLTPWIIVLALVLLGLFIFEPDVRQSFKPSAKNTPAEPTPDYILTNATRTEMNDEGQAKYRIFVKRLRHYQESDRSEFDAPVLTIVRDNAKWTVTSDAGQATQGGKEIQLWGNVVVLKHKTAGEPETQLDTEKLTFWPEQDLAETQSPVVIRQGKQQIHAVGMKVKLEERHIELLSNVRGHYEPETTVNP